MILNHAAADSAVQQKLCPILKFTLSKLRKNMILNHAAADTAVQRKLYPNFKFHLLKNLEKYDLKPCSHRHCGPPGSYAQIYIFT